MVINRVRVLGSGPHTPTQFFWEYSPPPPPRVIELHVSFVKTFKDLERRRRNESKKVISLVVTIKSRVRLLKICEINTNPLPFYPFTLYSLPFTPYPLPVTLYSLPVTLYLPLEKCCRDTSGHIRIGYCLV